MPSPRIAPAPDAAPGSADEHQAVAVVPLAETGLTADASAVDGGGSDTMDGDANGEDRGEAEEKKVCLLHAHL